MLFSRFLSFALFLVLLFVGMETCAQVSSPSATTSVVTEITADDFTKLHTIRSTSLAVFGVKLGDSLADTREKVQRAGLKLMASGGRFSVYENDGRTELFGIMLEGDCVVKLALFVGMANHLVGESRLLLGDEATRPDSAVRLKLLGREDRSSVERDPDGYTVRCAYDKEGLLLIRSYSRLGDAPTTLHLIYPAKAR